MSVKDGAVPQSLIAAGSLIAIGFILLGLAWAGANPPGASPDESAHVVKAYATADGQLRGEPYEADTSGMTPLNAAWFREVGRSYRIPKRVAPPETIQCYAFDRNRTADCQVFPATTDTGTALVPTHFGTYSPALYFPLGAVMQGAHDYRSAEWRGRLVALVLSGTMVSWAALLLARRGEGWIPLAGLALAATPMVVFLSASATTSGIEIASAICFWAALLRIARQPECQSGWPWAATAFSGGVLALSRPLDAVLIVTILATVILLVGADRLRQRASFDRRKAALASVALATCVAASALWSLIVTPHPSIDLRLAVGSLDDAIRDSPNQLRQIIGIFGWNDTAMPQVVYLIALSLLAAVTVGALIVGSRRERLAIGVLATSIVTIHLGIAVLVEAQIGFGMQARYVMPLIVGLILLSADVLEQHRTKLPASVASYGLAVAYVGSSLLQLVAFTTNAHRYAVGANGPWSLPWASRWAPPEGFVFWFGSAVSGALCVGLVGLLALHYARSKAPSGL
jgi:hypothetical protein